jgi:hypothetical protein
MPDVLKDGVKADAVRQIQRVHFAGQRSLDLLRLRLDSGVHQFSSLSRNWNVADEDESRGVIEQVSMAGAKT